MQKRLAAQEKQLRLAQMTEIRNVKAVIMKDAANYVRESIEKLLKVVSINHRQLANQFTQFRTKALNTMNKMDNYYIYLLEAEL